MVPRITVDEDGLKQVLTKVNKMRDMQSKTAKSVLYSAEKDSLFGFPITDNHPYVYMKPFKYGTCGISNLKAAMRVMIADDMANEPDGAKKALETYKTISLDLRQINIDIYRQVTDGLISKFEREEIIGTAEYRVRNKCGDNIRKIPLKQAAIQQSINSISKTDGSTPLIRAVEKGDIEAVRELLSTLTLLLS